MLGISGAANVEGMIVLVASGIWGSLARIVHNLYLSRTVINTVRFWLSGWSDRYLVELFRLCGRQFSMENMTPGHRRFP